MTFWKTSVSPTFMFPFSAQPSSFLKMHPTRNSYFSRDCGFAKWIIHLNSYTVTGNRLVVSPQDFTPELWGCRTGINFPHAWEMFVSIAGKWMVMKWLNKYTHWLVLPLASFHREQAGPSVNRGKVNILNWKMQVMVLFAHNIFILKANTSHMLGEIF